MFFLNIRVIENKHQGVFLNIGCGICDTCDTYFQTLYIHSNNISDIYTYTYYIYTI